MTAEMVLLLMAAVMCNIVAVVVTEVGVMSTVVVKMTPGGSTNSTHLSQAWPHRPEVPTVCVSHHPLRCLCTQQRLQSGQGLCLPSSPGKIVLLVYFRDVL